MSSSKFRQEQAINILENLSDQMSHVIDLMISRRDVIAEVDEKVEFMEEVIRTVEDWVDEIREEQRSE